MKPTPEIEEAVRRCQAGEAEPFRVIVDAYRRLAVTLAFRMLRDREEADDAAQDAFVRAWRSLPSLREPQQFRAWFTRIVTNLCLMRLRRARPPAVPWVEAPDLQSSTPDPGGPEALAIERITRERVERAIMELPLAYRTAVTLHHVADLTYEETARAMGVPVGTVKNQCWRAKRMLIERLKEAADET